ncbi:hypothetical protein ACJRPK_14055 [Aquimarina sp. 2-A2]|uniref:hypothetical protein n=1 Tax=Aquimarina sp. 2-A2 TaxID=3382644 RepID=UPI00387F24CF
MDIDSTKLILQALKAKSDTSGGHCGTYLVNLSHSTSIELKELKKALNELYKNKEIKIREGIHGKLIFIA